MKSFNVKPGPIVFCLLLGVLRGQSQDVRSAPGVPGVCLVTAEEEVIHNVTVHSPCIRRVTVPCGGTGDGPPRQCSLYAQRTCSHTTSRSQVQNVTREVCCPGWSEDLKGGCLPDEYINSLASQENTTLVGNATHNEDSMGEPSLSNTDLSETNITSSISTKNETTSLSASTIDTILSEEEGGGSLPSDPDDLDMVWMETSTLSSTSTPALVSQTNNSQSEEVTWGEGRPVVGPGDDSIQREEDGEGTLERPGEGWDEEQQEEQRPDGEAGYKDGNGEEWEEQEPEPRGESEENIDNEWQAAAADGYLNDYSTLMPESVMITGPSILTTSTTVVTSSSISTNDMETVASSTLQSLTSTLSSVQSSPTTLDSLPTSIPTPSKTSSITSTPSKIPSLTEASSIPSTSITPSSTPIPTTQLSHPHPHPHPHRPSTNSSYNVVQIPEVAAPETVAKEPDHTPNGSVVVLQSAEGMNGSIIPPVIYIAVTIATVVIVVTLVCALYVIVFRDKPRPGLQNGPSSGSSSSAFYLSESVYACNGNLQNVNANTESATMTTECEFSPRVGVTESPPVVCNGGKLSMGVGTEPPLTTSTPLTGGKRGFAYQNPAFSGDTGSLSDTSDVDINTKMKDASCDEKNNGGYLVPVRQRATPPPTPPKARNGVSDNMKNEIRRYGRIGIPVCEKVPLDTSIERDMSHPPPLCRMGSNETHTYEEIPAHLGGDPPADDVTVTSQVTPSDVSEDTEVMTGDDASVDLVTFMTDYLRKSRSITDPTTPRQGKRYIPPDPNATYDKADMYTPATPSGGEYAQTILVGPNGKLNMNDTRHSSVEYEQAVEVVLPSSDNDMNHSLPTPSYAEPIKRREREMEGGGRGDSRRCSSYENIYDTVTPCNGQDEEDMGKEGEDITFSDVTNSNVATPSPARRKLLFSPDVPAPDFISCDVIDLSDEVNDVAQWTNGNMKVPNGGELVAPPGVEEPKYLSLVMEDGCQGAEWQGGKPPLPTSPPPSDDYAETDA